MFRAILVEKTASGSAARVAELEDAQLPEGDVTVRVTWSTLNYKDALAITGRSPVVRKFPMVAGIDLAGTVESSRVEHLFCVSTAIVVCMIAQHSLGDPTTV